VKIEGYAVICDNDCIADANGEMPDSLRSEAEWAYFQDGLDAADVIVLGRKSHEVTPNPKRRLRLVMTGSVTTPHWEDERTVLWNPSAGRLDLALSLFPTPVDTLAITGGKLVFDHFLNHNGGFTCFHLSRMKDVYLRGGVKLFSALEDPSETPEHYLKSLGYAPTEWLRLDQQASVVRWRPQG
jgi:dihydrofolate reductase